MVIVSIVFIAVLATVNELTKARIEKNFEIEQAKEMLYAFDIFPEGFQRSKLSPAATTASIPWNESQVLQMMETSIKAVDIPVSDDLRKIIKGSFLDAQATIQIFEHINDKGETLAYGLPLEGKGLWGTIEGFGVISADLQKMQGIAFMKQVETPGLGARITEEEYKSYFRNLDLSGFHADETGQMPVIMVKDKDKTNEEESTNSVQAVTGATQTSQGVLNMVNDNLRVYMQVLKMHKT
jgi:Na(+)-translocating NADH:ubiquinone oxidoreductase C subunit